MFRNKVVVRADLPSSSPFLLRQLSLLHALSPPPSPLAIDVETLCWRISRRWRLACFLLSPDVFVIYQRTQSESVDRALEELVHAVPDISVGVEEEVVSASLVAKAVEIGLRTVMLDHKWTCVGNNTFVDSTFAGADEWNCVGALNLRVQPETDDGFLLLVSPEVLRFGRYKVADLVSSEIWESFDSGEQVMLEDYDFSTACTIIPSLCEAHVIGVCKLLPDEENFERLELLWSLKHGLALTSDYFISVQLAYGSHANKWFPSAYILQGPGFSPAPLTIRSLKAVDAIDSFIKIFGAWDFFNQGQLKVKEVSSLGIDTNIPVWIKATNSFTCCMARNKENADSQNSFGKIDLISRDLKSALDFRTPKPGIWFIHGHRMLEHNSVQEIATCSSNLHISTEHIRNGVNICSTTDSLLAVMKVPPVSTSIDSDVRPDQAWRPSFTKNKVMKNHKGRISPSQINDSYFAEEKHTSAESDQSVDFSQRSKGSRRKEKTEALHGSNISEDSGKEVQVETFGRKRQNIEKAREGRVEDSNVRAKQCMDQSVITAKVMNYYKRGKLQSLTIVDLKCFLTSRKAKVGGKKEELIKRVTSLLA